MSPLMTPTHLDSPCKNYLVIWRKSKILCVGFRVLPCTSKESRPCSFQTNSCLVCVRCVITTHVHNARVQKIAKMKIMCLIQVSLMPLFWYGSYPKFRYLLHAWQLHSLVSVCVLFSNKKIKHAELNICVSFLAQTCARLWNVQSSRAYGLLLER